MDGKLLTLPIGVQSFNVLRQNDYLYVDKTARLLELVRTSGRCFLSRPRRFGKSLTLSTLDAMFSGKAELFKGLAAEEWVREQAEHLSPVLRFDMSRMKTASAAGLEKTIIETLRRTAGKFKLILSSDTMEGMFQDILEGLFEAYGAIVVLIDEYDKPILDSIGDLNKANAMRETLRSFYTVLKGCDEYLRFVMLTGISKFSKAGVFSAMNNLKDISMSKRYGDIVGYTQSELEENFSDWMSDAVTSMSMSKQELLDKIRAYYDGFCFDGTTRLYNPFSILNFFSKQEFGNYWYESGSPSFIVEYMKQHGIKDPEEYSHVTVPTEFIGAHEIESSAPESFLYQSGYLTIEEKNEDTLVLGYPNYEVKKSIVRMYLDSVYHIGNYITLGGNLWKALGDGDVGEAVRLFNIALSGLPYTDFAKQDEHFYRSLFAMMLRGASITVSGEVQTNLGQSDAVILLPKRVVVLEFKFSKNGTGIKRLRQQGREQIEARNYAQAYYGEPREVTTAVIIIDGKKREAVL